MSIRFNKSKILVVGDLMLDEYIWGNVDRISPEAPVPVVVVEKENYVLGGAANVANNLRELDVNVMAAGMVGNDANSKILKRMLEQLDIEIYGIVPDPGRVTSIKTRIMAGTQHIVRVDRELTHKINDYYEDSLITYLNNVRHNVDGVIISDYNKGVVTDSLVRTITKIFADKFISVDPTNNGYSKYEGVSILTPNKKEASLASGINIVDTNSLYKAAKIILACTHVDNLLITCGKDGMVLFEDGKDPLHIESKAQSVYDVSGAGDTVIAVFTLAAVSGFTLTQSAEIANAAAAVVVAKLGTETVSLEEINKALL